MLPHLSAMPRFNRLTYNPITLQNQAMLKHILLFTIISVMYSFYALGANDSIPEKQLREVVVEGNRAWIQDGVINVIPQKNEKNLSDSPSSLIRIMHLPFLKESGNSIQNLNGESVSIYINGESASDTDIQTFWPKECKRLEYMEHPSDPKYGGAAAVVNFIMEEYEVGGVTRLSALQRFLNDGFYDASSKLVYKKMVYGFMINGGYERNPENISFGETDYKDLFYNGRHYDLISRTEETRIKKNSENLDVAFNARYRSDKARITHQVSLGWNHDPGSQSHGTDIWTDNLFGSSSSSSRTWGRILTPQFTGNYYFMFNDKWFLNSGFLTSYSRNNYSNTTRFGDAPEVYNSTKENAYRLNAYLQPYFQATDKIGMQLDLSGEFKWYETDYRGTVSSHESMNRQNLSGSLNIFWNPRRNLRFSLSPGFKAVLWQVAGENHHTFNPIVMAFATWNPNRKWRLRMNLLYSLENPEAADVNPVMVKTSPLLWTLGNPDLKASSTQELDFGATFLANGWLTMAAHAGALKTYKSIINIYRAAPPEDGGLIQESVNANTIDRVYGGISFSGRFFDNNLSIDYGPGWDYAHVSGSYFNHVSYITHSFNIDYTLKNFNASLRYFTTGKSLEQAGMGKSRHNSSFDFWLSYGTGDFLVRLGVKDVFNKYHKTWDYYVSEYYNTSFKNLEQNRKIVISLTYTFGYGKKVDKDISISGTEDNGTSVRKTSR